MAEAFLEEIYEEAALVCQLKQAVEYAKIHDELHMIAICNAVFQPLCKICKGYLLQDREKGMALWDAVQTLVKIDNDLVRRGDCIEEKILPLLKEKRKCCGGDIRVENEEGTTYLKAAHPDFDIEGFKISDKYIHSAADPMWEAFKLAEYIFSPEKKEYTVWGLGLGYLIYQLYHISDGTVRIRNV